MAHLDHLLTLAATPPPNADTVDVLVKIGGRPLDDATAAALLDLTVEQKLGAAAHLTLRLAGWDPDSEQLTLVDEPMFTPGSSVEVELGYLDQRAPVFSGEIVGLELEASTSDRAVVTVNAYDLLHRLGRGQRDAIYEKSTYAAIARRIGENIYRIAVDADDDTIADPENEVVNQENTSDFDFLTRRAAEIGYELSAAPEGKTLVFRKSRIGAPASITLDASFDLVQFSAQLDAAGQLGGVDVLGFDSDTKKRISASVDNDSSLDPSYGSVPSRSRIADSSAVTQEEATARANAELSRIRAGFLVASGSCFGRTDLRPGLMIEITGLGRRFSGAYYVTGATHSLSPSGGYRTSFALEGEPR